MEVDSKVNKIGLLLYISLTGLWRISAMILEGFIVLDVGEFLTSTRKYNPQDQTLDQSEKTA
jgi:hypothetical protein